jgi:hypothetical protein
VEFFVYPHSALLEYLSSGYISSCFAVDLKDHRRLKRIQEQKQANDGEPRKPNQNDLISAQVCLFPSF